MNLRTCVWVRSPHAQRWDDKPRAIDRGSANLQGGCLASGISALSLSLSLHAVYMESNGTRDRTEGGEVGDQLIVIRSEAPARHTKNVAVQRTSTRHLDVSKRVWRFALRCRRTRVRHKIRFGSRQLDSVKFSHHSD
jgi:hypothetical protein